MPLDLTAEALAYPGIDPDAVRAMCDRLGFNRLRDQILAEGYRALRDMGLPDGAWFVPVHARDGIFAPTVEHRYDYRNCHISNYGAAVDAIIARGGWCIQSRNDFRCAVKTVLLKDARA